MPVDRWQIIEVKAQIKLRARPPRESSAGASYEMLFNGMLLIEFERSEPDAEPSSAVIRQLEVYGAWELRTNGRHQADKPVAADRAVACEGERDMSVDEEEIRRQATRYLEKRFLGCAVRLLLPTISERQLTGGRTIPEP